MKRLPVGLQSFQELIKNNYVYVDKTELIHELITRNKNCFLSRPRRFGKSLFVSVLHELFAGNKSLFDGLWIANNNYDWQMHPVIHLDFSVITRLNPDILRQSLLRRVLEIGEEYQITISSQQPVEDAFNTLITRLATINKVVILIDEYDKPILDHIDDLALAQEMRKVLQSFYGVMKGMDAYTRFVLLTGVTRFSKTSVFSGLNNLRDISMAPECATLCGYTHEELKTYFKPHIAHLAKQLNKTSAQTIEQLEEYYDGYRFVASSPCIYNPYSVLNALNDQPVEGHLGSYWFESGTPTFLVHLFQNHNYALDTVEQPIMSAQELGSFEIDRISLPTLLYQTGYLTIKQYNRDTRDYTLDFPNHEVGSAFSLLLANIFAQLTNRQAKTYAAAIAQAFRDHDLNEIKTQLQELFDSMPYTVHVKNEHYFQFILYSIFKLIGLEVDPEVTTSTGRADLIVSLPGFVYVIELKINKTAKTALKQILDKRYYAQYAPLGKIELVGIAFSTKTKTISLAHKTVQHPIAK